MRCVVVAAPGSQRLALSVSGPLTPVTDEFVASKLVPMHDAAAEIAADLSARPRRGSCGGRSTGEARCFGQ